MEGVLTGLPGQNIADLGEMEIAMVTKRGSTVVAAVVGGVYGWNLVLKEVLTSYQRKKCLYYDIMNLVEKVQSSFQIGQKERKLILNCN